MLYVFLVCSVRVLGSDLARVWTGGDIRFCTLLLINPSIPLSAPMLPPGREDDASRIIQSQRCRLITAGAEIACGRVYDATCDTVGVSIGDVDEAIVKGKICGGGHSRR